MRTLDVFTADDLRTALAEFTGQRVLLYAWFDALRLTGVALASSELTVHVPRHYVEGRNAEPAVLHPLGDFFASGPDLWVESMTPVAALKHRLNLPVAPVGDLVTLCALHREKYDTHWLDVRERHAQDVVVPLASAALAAHATLDRLVPKTMRFFLELEGRAALALAGQSELGYAVPSGLFGPQFLSVVHPEWITVQPDGGGLISCRAPNLLGVKRADRTKWVAPPGCVWVQLQVPEAHVRMSAALSGDEWLIAHLDDPKGALAEVWGVDRITAEALLPIWLRAPFHVNYLSSRSGLPMGDVVRMIGATTEVAPAWAAWVIQTAAAPRATSWLGRPVTDTEAGPNEKWYAHRLSGVLQDSVATLVKTQIVQVAQHAALRTRDGEGVENLMPQGAGMAYTVPMSSIDVGHLDTMTRILKRTINDVPFPVQVSLGPNWGGLTPWTPGAFSKQSAELSSGFDPHQCPDCGAIFTTAELLTQHRTHEPTSPAL